MKIRTDFVTNSSSSSFCSIHISGSKLTEILKKYKSVFESEDFDVTINDSGFDYSGNDGEDYEGPENKNDMARCFIEVIRDLVDYCEQPEEFNALIEELEESEEEINKTITSLDWSICENYWGSEAESAWDNIDEDFIRTYMGLEEDDEITEKINDEFNDMLTEATAQEITNWKYDGKKLKITEDFSLL